MQPVPQQEKRQKPPQTEALEIQVSGQKNFEGARWRAAIEHFLEAKDKGKVAVTHRPKLRFWMGGESAVTLSLAHGETYCAYGVSTAGQDMPEPPIRGLRIVKGCERGKVDNGLREFVKDNSIRMLVIELSGTAKVVLWKARQRSFLGIAATGIPKEYAV